MEVPKRRDLDRLQDEIQDLIDELWAVPRFSGLRHGFRPQVDCLWSDDPAELSVTVELAGVDPDDVHIYADDRVLVIAGERRRSDAPGRYQQMEIEYGPFQRRIALPERVDPSAAHAEYARGLLTIVLPAAEQAPPKSKVSIAVWRGS
jgi:HSP20 family protein